jgi:8-oxo-dGTP diphosphatase
LPEFSLPEIHVAAGVIANAAGEVLIAQRTAGRELAGAWEFPGGKLAAGESALDALRRELREELGIELIDAAPLLDYRHRYPARVVRLDVWRVLRFRGEPAGLEGQALRWAAPAELVATGLLEADLPIVAALLPP